MCHKRKIETLLNFCFQCLIEFLIKIDFELFLELQFDENVSSSSFKV